MVRGLPEKTRPGGHGLKNIALRASRIHAALEYKNENGLTITITGKKIKGHVQRQKKTNRNCRR